MDPNAPRAVGEWGRKEYVDPNATVVWASERDVYEWLPEYTDESAPENKALESQLFGDENRINTGINWFNRHKPTFKDADVILETPAVPTSLEASN